MKLRAALPITLALAAGCAEAKGEGGPTPPKPRPAAAPEGAAKKSSQKAVRVETAKLRPGRPKLALTLPGEVEGYRESRLASANGGYVEKVLKRRGDRVQRGQAIAYVDRAVHDLGVETAAAQAELAATELAVTQKAGDSLPKSRRDAAAIQAKVADTQVRMAKIRADRAVIKAPFSGVLAALDVEEGEVLPPGGPVGRLVSLDPALVTVSVSDRDVVSLRPGLDVRVALDARSELRDGRVTRISPAADTETRAFEVEIEVPNKDRKLLPGMIAQVSLSVEMKDEGLALPQYVLVTRREGNGVFVIEGDRARWRPLELGSVVRDQVIVTGGLSEGEQVIVTGHRELADGDPVIVARDGTCCEDGKVSFAQARGS